MMRVLTILLMFVILSCKHPRVIEISIEAIHGHCNSKGSDSALRLYKIGVIKLNDTISIGTGEYSVTVDTVEFENSTREKWKRKLFD